MEKLNGTAAAINSNSTSGRRQDLSLVIFIDRQCISMLSEFLSRLPDRYSLASMSGDGGFPVSNILCAFSAGNTNNTYRIGGLTHGR